MNSHTEHDTGSSLPAVQYPLPRIQTDGNRLIFVDESSTATANPVWDALWRIEWPGHIAVAVAPSEEHVAKLKQNYRIELNDELHRTENWTEKWLEYLRENLYSNAAMMELPGDYCPALDVPGFAHGQSQGIADLFGAEIKPLPDGNFHVSPLPANPKSISEIKPFPIETSLYYRAVEYIHYAHSTTGGVFPFHNPVMTGPLDTANYLLGTTTLMEWLFTEPDAVGHLMNTITDVLIEMIRALHDAAGGALCSHHLRCARGGFDMCSEVRSLISLDLYEQFEAPCLRRIGQTLGPFSAHSCGNWERTIPNIISDPNYRAMNGQIKENDLATLCDLASGKLTLSIGRSMDVHDRFMWPDTESYYRHILETVPDGQPFELIIETENDLGLWDKLHLQIRGKKFQWTNLVLKTIPTSNIL